MHVPCVIFDGKSEDFATEMFVIINSTPTRINKSHLVDLYERVSWAAPDKKFAAHVVEMLYSEGDSPLRYRINRLGGRSKQEKWILQAELFNEIHRWVTTRLEKRSRSRSPQARRRALLRDRARLLQGRREGVGRRVGQRAYMVTRPVTLKAMLRVCADLAHATPSRTTIAWRAGRRGSRRGPSMARRLPQRRLLRALPRQGPGRARRAHSPRARTLRGDRAAPSQRRRRTARVDYGRAALTFLISRSP